MTPILEPGALAPDFTAPVTGDAFPADDSVTLSSLRGKTVVLYFYPKDDTPGCTTQACALRDAWSAVTARAALFGISPDSSQSHAKFIAKHSLPFPLIADPDHTIAAAYGVWVEKSLYGRKYMGAERTTFIIAPDGTIQTILRKVKPERHLDLLLTALPAST